MEEALKEEASVWATQGCLGSKKSLAALPGQPSQAPGFAENSSTLRSFDDGSHEGPPGSGAGSCGCAWRQPRGAGAAQRCAVRKRRCIASVAFVLALGSCGACGTSPRSRQPMLLLPLPGLRLCRSGCLKRCLSGLSHALPVCHTALSHTKQLLRLSHCLRVQPSASRVPGPQGTTRASAGVGREVPWARRPAGAHVRGP